MEKVPNEALSNGLQVSIRLFKKTMLNLNGRPSKMFSLLSYMITVHTFGVMWKVSNERYLNHLLL